MATSHRAEAGCYTPCGCHEVAPSPQHVLSVLPPVLETLSREGTEKKEEVGVK